MADSAAGKKAGPESARSGLRLICDLVNSYETVLGKRGHEEAGPQEGPQAGAAAVTAEAPAGESEPLEAWLARHTGTTKLPDPPALERWLRERGFAVHHELNERDLDSVIRFREALRVLLLANNGAEPDRRAIAVLREAAERVRMRVAVDDRCGASLEPAGEGVEALFAAVLAAIAAAQADGSWERLKACRAEDCRYAFIDESKNHSRAWCSMKVCGNRAKTRAYRARRGGKRTRTGG